MYDSSKTLLIQTAGFVRYGDHLYSKGDFEGSMSCYLKTVGTVQASYVIRKVSSSRYGPPGLWSRSDLHLLMNSVPRRTKAHSPHFVPPRTPFTEPRQQRYHDPPPQLLHEACRRRGAFPIHPLIIPHLVFHISTQHERRTSRRTPLRPRNGDPSTSTSFFLLARDLARSTIQASLRVPSNLDRRYFGLLGSSRLCWRSREE